MKNPEERLELCRSCEHLDKNHFDILDRCKLCGCIVEVKSRIPHLHCPLDPPKW